MVSRNVVRLILVILVIALLCSTSVFAHTTSQEGILESKYISNPNYADYYIGGEDIGWFINEKCHAGVTTQYYTFDGVTTGTQALF